MKQIYISTLLISSILFMGITSTNAGTYGGGNGTSGSPFLISNADHLVELSTTLDDWSAHFELTSDIDMANKTFYSIGYATVKFDNDNDESTGNESIDRSFKGKIDGKNFVISNLNVQFRTAEVNGDADQDAGSGLIGRGNGCQISNLGIINASVRMPSSLYNVGFVIGALTDGNVENCFALSGDVYCRKAQGGIVGALTGESTVKNCMSSIMVDSYYDKFCGGIVGRMDNNAKIMNCVSYCDFFKRGNPTVNAGGIVAKLDDGASAAQSTDCYYNAKCGANLETGGTALTTEQMRDQANYANLDFSSAWKLNENGFAILKSFDDARFKVTITSSINTDSTGNGTISPAEPKTVNIGELATFDFTTSGYVSDIAIDGVSQDIDKPMSYVFDCVCRDHKMMVAFNDFPSNVDAAACNQLKISFINHTLSFEGASKGLNNYSIYNLSGKQLTQKQFRGTNYSIKLEYTKGIYIIQLQSDARNYSKKIAIQ